MLWRFNPLKRRRPKSIGAAVMALAGGDSGYSCSGKKEVKAYFRFFKFSGVRGIKLEGTNTEVSCWAQTPNGPVAVVGK
jgi:hypothetical protein